MGHVGYKTMLQGPILVKPCGHSRGLICKKLGQNVELNVMYVCVYIYIHIII